MNPPGRVPELLRQREFRRYWSAETISMFGDQVSSVAIPYTGILALHADAAEMGFLAAAIWLASLIFAVHAGAWADRFGHRRILRITADLGRAGLLALIPVAAGPDPGGRAAARAGSLAAVRGGVRGLTGFRWLLPSPLPGFPLPPENTPEAFSVKEEKSDIRDP
jgi:MFS family permease